MKTLLLITLLLLPQLMWAQDKIDELEQYEIRSYNPKKIGLNDLVFEARIEHLTEILSKNTALGKLVDVSFKIYWLSPSEYRIEVQGLPKGFSELRQDLMSLIRGKLEFVLPEAFSEKFKGYTFKAEPIANGKLIKAIDDTYTMAVPEVDIVIDKNGVLKTVETKAAMSALKTEFFYSPKSWSNNKLVLDKIVLTSPRSPIKAFTSHEIEYTNVAGMGFPSKIKVKNYSEVVVPASGKTKEKKIKNENGSVIVFSKYEVNTGKAQKYLNDLAKK